jgi:UDP-N-acetylmuramoylalanine--D-glutamate ligase
MQLEGKKALVVGLGKTGDAVCTFLLDRGVRIKISEKRTQEEMWQKFYFWSQKGVQIESGGHNRDSFIEADLIIPSPGVPPLPEFEEARERGAEILSEVELAFRFLSGKIVGITGTNGKSTTTTLTHKILKDSGLLSYLAGNIGTPLIHFVPQDRSDNIYVTELSSFQLKYISQFQADISVFLNVTPDHLDWHCDFEDYYASKKNLIATQREDDIAVLNRDDPLVWKLRKEARANIFAFSQKHAVDRGCHLQNDEVIFSQGTEEKVIRVSEIPLLGPHNLENVMASASVAGLFGVSPASIRNSIKGFRGLDHRLEKVATWRGVEFYNDSKATNVNATLKSLLSFGRKTVLILGGKDKEGDFSLLRTPVKERVKNVILLGEASEKIRRALQDVVPTEKVFTMAEAVQRGFSYALPKGIVLLSPACASFDMFANFEERGNVFKAEIQALMKSFDSRRK